MKTINKIEISNINNDNTNKINPKFKIKEYEEIKEYLFLNKSKNNDGSNGFPAEEFLIINIFTNIFEQLIYFMKKTSMVNYIRHHLNDNLNTSYTTFIYVNVCKETCHHSKYLDRECACKFILCINSWFAYTSKQESSIGNTQTIQSLLNQLDINENGKKKNISN